jgi:hypothetical protein
MIIVIRGHLRNSFETNQLYNFIEELHNVYPDLKIFIHTWNIFANNVSWRNIDVNSTEVNEERINNYFGKLSNCIKHIIIDNDKDIKLIGNLVGTINNGPMPIIGWKNYWYGKYKIIDYIYNQQKYDEETVVNLRFDLFSNSNNFDKNLIINFIKKNNEIKFTKNKFLFDYEANGIDNIYIGNINTMYKLTNKFFYELDDILCKNNNTRNQERLVYRINEQIFNLVL